MQQFSIRRGLKGFRVFSGLYPAKMFLFDFLLNHCILSIFCAMKEKKTSNFRTVEKPKKNKKMNIEEVYI